MLPLATRGIGAIPLLRELLPPVAVDAFAVVTWLGSVPLLMGVFTLAYWFGPRRRGAVGLATLLAAFAVTLGLKALFGLPRPPMALRWIEASGFGFPSGHAIAATVGWGYLAMVQDRWPTRRRVGLAAVLVGAVAISRVVVGVHYAVDVVAGVAVGLAVLGIVGRVTRPDVAFGFAAGTGLVAVVLTGGGGDASLLFGAAIGGGLLWTRLGIPADPWGRDGLLPAAGGGAGVGALVLIGYTQELAVTVELVIGALAVVGVLGLPVLVEWVRGER